MMTPLSKKTVLVVSDDPKLITTLDNALGEHYQVTNISAFHGKLKRRLEEIAPDIVIQDAIMPWLFGIELSLRIRRWVPEVPILMLSSWETKENMLRSFDLKSDTYLSEPVSVEELKTRIEVILARNEP